MMIESVMSRATVSDAIFVAVILMSVILLPLPGLSAFTPARCSLARQKRQAQLLQESIVLSRRRLDRLLDFH